MITTPEVKQIYASIQKQLFYLIPEKWDRIYLYASVTQQMLNLETGELFFYYFPKGILKKNPVNVYEIPSRFSLNEEEYVQLVEGLYHTIKKLREVYKKRQEKLWSNITIKIEALKFEVEFHYDDLSQSSYSSDERHLIWKYCYLDLPLESFFKKDRKLIQKYLEENVVDTDIEVYSESIYKRPLKNLIDYNKEQQVEKFVTQTEQQRREEEAKKRFEEQRYVYQKSQKRGLRKQYHSTIENHNQKTQTYIEQIEAQRNAVKSQILNHL